MEEIRWEETDPQGRRVVLKASTFDEHIKKDHDDDDAAIRIKNEEHAKKAIARPHLVILDPEDHDRHIYYRIILANNGEPLKKVKNMRVVVDTDREPNEVVTWIVEKKMKGSAKKEWIIYDGGGNNVPRLSGEQV